MDECIFLAMPGPASYTREDVCEIQCHGGSAAVEGVLDIVARLGARPAEPGEFTFRAFANGRIDLAQAEAVADLVRARTGAARRAAVRQLRGDLSGRLARLRQGLVDVMARIEVEIDFPDEGLGGIRAVELTSVLEGFQEELRSLLAQAVRGRVLREGFQVAILGRPNVGKSSLFNALLAQDRAIVTAQPGTTRDTIEGWLDLGGVPVVLEDTAGLREAAEEAEAAGVARARRAAEAADLAVVVLDDAAGVTAEDERILAGLTAQEFIVVINKVDLGAGLAWQRRAALPEGRVLAVSALTGEGLNGLRQVLGKRAAGPGTESVLVTRERHRACLERAIDGLGQATAGGGLPAEIVAIDVREAIGALGEITGEGAPEDVIEAIFANFCVGK